MSFLAELSLLDLQRLRKVVRGVHMKHYPLELMTDHEADRIIESLGVEVREKLIRKAVDERLVS